MGQTEAYIIKIWALGKENKSMKEDPHGFSQEKII